MQKQIALRLIVGLLVIAILFVGYQKLKTWGEDPLQVERMDSAGWIAAIEQVGDSSRAVVFDANSKKMVDDKWKEPATEDSISWMPDGNRLVFSSDRGGRSQNLYYWIPTKGITEKFKEQSRSMSSPWFAPNDPAQQSGLMLSGGNVWEFIPKNKFIRQVLPPLLRAAGDGEEGSGSTSSMEAIYKNLGSSFKDAAYIGQREAILTVMRREEGEIAVINFLGPDATGKPRLPVGMVSGNRIEMASNNGDAAIIVVHGFQWTDPERIPDQFRKGAVTTRPYKNAVIQLANAATSQPQAQFIVAAGEDSQEGFGFPAVSPDGTQLVLVVSKLLSDNKSEPLGLVLMPVKEGGGKEVRPLAQGDISEPSWSPDGKKITYIKRENGKNSLYSVNADGSGETKVAEGDFSQPKFSPQTPKS